MLAQRRPRRRRRARHRRRPARAPAAQPHPLAHRRHRRRDRRRVPRALPGRRARPQRRQHDAPRRAAARGRHRRRLRAPAARRTPGSRSCRSAASRWCASCRRATASRAGARSAPRTSRDEPLVWWPENHGPGAWREVRSEVYGEPPWPPIARTEPEEERIVSAVAEGAGISFIMLERSRSLHIPGAVYRRFAAPEPDDGNRDRVAPRRHLAVVTASPRDLRGRCPGMGDRTRDLTVPSVARGSDPRAAQLSPRIPRTTARSSPTQSAATVARRQATNVSGRTSRQPLSSISERRAHSK